ncbi:MAG: matrixin family metalloprotease [Pseudomonadota bacterium]
MGEATSINGHVGNGKPVVVTYAFSSASDLNFTNYTVADQKLKVNVRKAVDVIEKTTGVKMVEVESTADEMISIFYNDRTDTVSWANYPNSTAFSPDTRGNIGMNRFYDDYKPGSAGFQILLHEFGHALGLKHPFDGSPNLPSRLDNTNNTIMSYNWKGAYKSEFQRFDRQALDELYGGPNELNGVTVRWAPGRDTLTIIGTRKSDDLLGVNDRNWIDGGFGNDLVAGRDAQDTLRGGGGNDTIRGFDGNDVIRGAGGNDLLNGSFGNDRILGANGNDTLRGGTGDDNLDGGAGNDRMFGEFGSNNMLGGAGNDLINGGSSADRLVGHQGMDTLKGGFGRDVFVLTPDGGRDRILDFNQFEGDLLNVRALGMNRAEALSRLQKVGNNMKFENGDDDVILVGQGNAFFDGSEFIV